MPASAETGAPEQRKRPLFDGLNLSRRQPATTAGAPTDHARVCLAAPQRASATLPVTSTREAVTAGSSCDTATAPEAAWLLGNEAGHGLTRHRSGGTSPRVVHGREPRNLAAAEPCYAADSAPSWLPLLHRHPRQRGTRIHQRGPSKPSPQGSIPVWMIGTHTPCQFTSN